jgi:hypothetical protein
MRAFALLCAASPALGGSVNVPHWPGSYNMSLSTIIMPVRSSPQDPHAPCHAGQPVLWDLTMAGRCRPLTPQTDRRAVRQQRADVLRPQLADHPGLRRDRHRAPSLEFCLLSSLSLSAPPRPPPPNPTHRPTSAMLSHTCPPQPRCVVCRADAAAVPGDHRRTGATPRPSGSTPTP